MENIAIIIIDALRPKNLSLFGYEKETDKNLKKIADEGILFKKFFSVSNSTFPSITSLFTGKYPNNHGIIHQAPYATDEEYEKIEREKFWLVNFLKEKGYRTIAIDWIGLWFKEGFDYYGERKEAFYKKFTKNSLAKKILLNLPSWAYKFGKSFVKKKNESLFPSAKEMVDVAISQIKESKKLEKPFFLFMHFEDTHFPYPNVPNPEPSGDNDIEKVLENIKSPPQREYFKKRIVDIELKSIKDMKNKYDLAIEGIDNQIGRLREFLMKDKEWENTLFIILSDHGDSLDEHEIYFSHAGLFDESVHVPLIIKIPGFEKKEISELVQTVDIAPTILDRFNESIEDFDGKSLLPLIKDGIPLRDKVFLFDGLAENIRAIRSKDKKIIIAEGNKCNLCKSEHHKKYEEYDLKKDPRELNNIYKEKKKTKLK
ncbi:MAG: sulfatase [Candidatus Pacearchaeota archaeon]